MAEPPGEDEVRAARGPWAGSAAHLDAPFATTPPDLVERMLELSRVGPSDHLVDLGCGDGRIVLAAARRGASALGVDIDPARIAQAEEAAKRSPLPGTVRFRVEDMFTTPLDEASVVTLFLLPHVNRLLHSRLRTLRRGARIVGHAYPIAGWTPDLRERHGGRELYLWVVPQAS